MMVSNLSSVISTLKQLRQKLMIVLLNGYSVGLLDSISQEENKKYEKCRYNLNVYALA